MTPNIIIPAISILTIIVSIGSVALSLFSVKKRREESYDFRADDDMLALAPLVQRRRFESQASYRIRLNQKKIEEIDKTLAHIDENLLEIKRMNSDIKRMRSKMFPAS